MPSPETPRIKFYLVPCDRGRRIEEHRGSSKLLTGQLGADLAEARELLPRSLQPLRRCHDRCCQHVLHLREHLVRSIPSEKEWRM